MFYLSVFVVAGFVCMLISSEALAENYSESVSGDLSNNPAAPTVIPVSAGSNAITGTTGTVDGVTDLDYFTITVPPGSTLQSINETTYTLNGAPSTNLSFIGVESGTTFTPAATTTAAQTLGYDHFSLAQVNTNILPGMGTAAGAMDFTPPLGAGNYTFWIQEANQPLIGYGFNLVIAAQAPGVPPGFLIFVAAGMIFVGARATRAKRKFA